MATMVATHWPHPAPSSTALVISHTNKDHSAGDRDAMQPGVASLPKARPGVMTPAASDKMQQALVGCWHNHHGKNLSHQAGAASPFAGWSAVGPRGQKASVPRPMQTITCKRRRQRVTDSNGSLGMNIVLLAASRSLAWYRLSHGVNLREQSRRQCHWQVQDKQQRGHNYDKVTQQSSISSKAG